MTQKERLENTESDVDGNECTVEVATHEMLALENSMLKSAKELLKKCILIKNVEKENFKSISLSTRQKYKNLGTGPINDLVAVKGGIGEIISAIEWSIDSIEQYVNNKKQENLSNNENKAYTLDAEDLVFNAILSTIDYSRELSFKQLIAYANSLKEKCNAAGIDLTINITKNDLFILKSIYNFIQVEARKDDTYVIFDCLDKTEITAFRYALPLQLIEIIEK